MRSLILAATRAARAWEALMAKLSPRLADALNVLLFSVLVSAIFFRFNSYSIMRASSLIFVCSVCAALSAGCLLLRACRAPWLFYALLAAAFVDLGYAFLDISKGPLLALAKFVPFALLSFLARESIAKYFLALMVALLGATSLQAVL